MKSKDKKFDVDDCLEAVGFGHFQYRLLIVCGLGVMADSGEYVFSIICTCIYAFEDKK